jgi:glucokinase
MNIIGIDLGGTFVKLGILNSGRLRSEAEIPVSDNQSLKANIPALEKGIKELLAQAGIEQVDGIGLAFPGQVDSKNMRVLQTTKYLDAPEFNFRKWAMDKWKSAIVMDNDARMACIGEWRHGAGKDCRNMLMVTLGTGIGSGVIMDDEIVYGKNFRAGNLIGHTIVDHQGEICQCGNRGCAEAMASTWGLQKFLRNDPEFKDSIYAGWEEIDFRRLFENYSGGEAFAGRIIDYCIEIWSAAIANFVNDFDPERVVIGGGIMKSEDIILPRIKEKVLSRTWSSEAEVEFRTAKLGNFASFWGSHYLLGRLSDKKISNEINESGYIH